MFEGMQREKLIELLLMFSDYRFKVKAERRLYYKKYTTNALLHMYNRKLMQMLKKSSSI